MKNRVFIIITMILVCFTSCVSPLWNPPIKQNNTYWVEESYKLYFYVDENEPYSTVGYMQEGVKIRLAFGYDDRSIIFSDDVYNKEDALGPNAIILEGDCDFSKEQYKMTITESTVDFISIDEQMIFTRVKELPDWAVQLKEENDDA